MTSPEAKLSDVKFSAHTDPSDAKKAADPSSRRRSQPEKSRDETESESFAELLENSFKYVKPNKNSKSRPVPLKKRLKRYPPAEMELDLHGCTAMEAEFKVKSFLISAKQQGYFTVRIIVGKGLHSESGPVLPGVIEDVLKLLQVQGIVLHYSWGKKTKARSGALTAYIKQFDQYD